MYNLFSQCILSKYQGSSQVEVSVDLVVGDVSEKMLLIVGVLIVIIGAKD